MNKTMKEVENGNQAGPGSERETTTVKEFLKLGNFLYDGARSAMRGAPPPLRAGIYTTLAFAILGLGYFAIPPYEAPKQSAGLVIAGLFLLAFAILFAIAFRRLPRPEVPKITGALQLALRPILENARAVVRDRLQRENGAVTDDDIRANIFLPEEVQIERSKEIKLRIPPTLCIKMQNQDERDIVFSAGAGATGHAFQFGEPLIAYRNPTERRGWDKKYKITAAQAKVVDADLKWIISMPIKGPTRHTLGVANVDGLRHEFKHDVLVECSIMASAFVEVMGKLIRGV